MKKGAFALLLAVLMVSFTGCYSLASSLFFGASGEETASGYAADGYAEGRIGDTMHTSFFDFTVNRAKVCETYSSHAAAEGNQLLVVEITVRNTSRQSIEMYDTDFQAQWGAEGEDDFRFPITTDPETFEELPPLTEEQLPGTYPMAVNEERTGLLVYEVPAGYEDFSISYQEIFSDESTGDLFFVFFTAESGGETL